MSWRTVKLGEVVEYFSVRAKEIEDYSDLIFCGVSNQDGITVSKYAAEDKIEDYKIIEKGCFAYNPYRVNVGSIALLNEDRKGLISPAYVVFKTKPETIIDELLLKFLKSKEGLRQIKLHARGTVRQALRFEDLCQIELSIPDFEEQYTLFGKLATQQKFANNLTTELNYQLSLVKKLRQAYLREAIQGKLVTQDSTDETAQILLEKIKAEKEKLIAEKKIKRDKPLPPINAEEIPFEIPSNWTWCRLGEICGFITKGTTPNLNKITSDGEIPYLKVYNIVQQKLDFEYKPQFIDNETHVKVLNRSRVFPNDVLMNIVGPPLGKVALIPDTYPEWNINQALAIFRPLVKGVSHFLYHYLCEGSRIRIIRTLGVVGQDNISLEQSRNIIFPLPPLAEQERIVAKLEKLMKFCDELEANISQGIANADQLLQTALKEALEQKEKI